MPGQQDHQGIRFGIARQFGRPRDHAIALSRPQLRQGKFQQRQRVVSSIHRLHQFIHQPVVEVDAQHAGRLLDGGTQFGGVHRCELDIGVLQDVGQAADAQGPAEIVGTERDHAAGGGFPRLGRVGRCAQAGDEARTHTRLVILMRVGDQGEQFLELIHHEQHLRFPGAVAGEPPQMLDNHGFIVAQCNCQLRDRVFIEHRMQASARAGCGVEQTDRQVTERIGRRRPRPNHQDAPSACLVKPRQQPSAHQGGFATARTPDHRHERHARELRRQLVDIHVAAKEKPAILLAKVVQPLVRPRQRRPCQLELIRRNNERRASGCIAGCRGGHADDRVGHFVEQRRAAEPALDEEPRQRIAVRQQPAMLDRCAEFAGGIHAAVLSLGKPLGPERLPAMRQAGCGAVWPFRDLAVEFENGDVGGTAIAGRTPFDHRRGQRDVASRERKIDLNRGVGTRSVGGLPRAAQRDIHHVRAGHHMAFGDQERRARDRRCCRTADPRDGLLQ
jgi:hypothetical protein